MDAEQEIRRRIRKHGRITFAEFMEVAQFWPRGGYYSVPGNIGSTGDFYTAPTAHPAFGALLCVQVFQMWRLLGRPPTFWVVEMGAADGLLCRDIVEYSLHLPEGFGDSLRYVCLDRFPSWDAEAEWPADLAGKPEALAALGVPLSGITGCFLSNELIDSFPVYRVTAQGGALKEVYVTLEGEDLVDVVDHPSTPELKERLDSLGLALPDGVHAEINLAMGPWLQQVSSALDRGFLLTVDYGHTAAELYSQHRRRGTLTGFRNHSQTDSLYRSIGKQDMTAHVDFTSLEKLGQPLGLEVMGSNAQREFLNNLGLGSFLGSLRASGLKQHEVEANRLGMVDIIRPGGMGEFKVLASGKGVGSPSLWGFERSPELEGVLEELPVPLLTPRHMPLLEGRYPHQSVDWEELLK